MGKEGERKTHPIRHMLDQLSGVAFTPCAGLAANVHQVVRVIVPGAHHIVLGVVQEGKELVVEANLAF